MESEIFSCLQLRQAGGKAYLIDHVKAGLPYHKPIAVNESGAEMFEHIVKAGNMEKAAEEMAEQYGVDVQTVLDDMRQFSETIRSNYVVWN